MTQLSEHFSLEEMIATGHGPNVPTPEIIDNLTVTANGMEAVRHLLGDRPIHVNSGYRCPAVNKAVGGVPNSAHLTGFAVDFVCPEFGTPLEICKVLATAPLKWDQLIFEQTWCHVSFAPTMRQEVLTSQNGHYGVGLAG